MSKTLIFVYNANSGWWNATLDTAHKLLSPETYSCHLCAITYGMLNAKKEWTSFIKSLPVKSQFLHKDEWIRDFHRTDDLPAIFLMVNNQIDMLIDSKTLIDLNLHELMELIKEKILP